MFARLKRRGLVAALAGVAASALLPAPSQAQAQSGEPIKIGFCMALTGPLAAERQAGAARHEDLGGGDQRQGRPARPPGQARSITTIRPTRRRCRASTPSCIDVDKVDLVIGPYATKMAAAGDAGRHAEGQGVHHPVRARGEHRVQVSEISSR